jgi:hypothetical protein
MPGAAVWAGIALIAVGLVLGIGEAAATLKRLQGKPIRSAAASPV